MSWDPTEIAAAASKGFMLGMLVYWTALPFRAIIAAFKVGAGTE